MATIHHSHQRTPSSGHKFVLRPTSTHPHITKNHSSGKLSTKSAKHQKRKSTDEDLEILAGDFDMATSFHQFCATCEKQIAVPNSSVLYCSESCRRRDGTVGSFVGAPPSPPLLSEYEAFTKRPALSRRKLQHSLSAPYIPAVQHDGKPDMDPTEWKPDSSPVSGSGIGASASSAVLRRPSEAMLYLSQYYRSSDSLMNRLSSRDKTRNCASTTEAQVTAPIGKAKGFFLIASGSNDSSVTGSLSESRSGSISAMTTGTAPSVVFENELEISTSEGLDFNKKKIEAREDISGSLGALLITGANA